MPVITFSDPPVTLSDQAAAMLPWNYLSPAFSDLLSRAGGKSRILMALSHGDVPSRFAVVGTETLREPAATAAFLAQVQAAEALADVAEHYFLGPTTRRSLVGRIVDPPEVFPLSAKHWKLPPEPDFEQSVVIIDAGIAFWNARFRGLSGPRFRGVRFLDFDEPDLGLGSGLDENDIATLCALADQKGNAAVMRALGEAYSDSFYGTLANPDPDGLWHGTAAADLAAGATPGEADHVALFALELPREVMADYSGETLTAVLAMILPAAIQMTAAFANRPLTVVMPLGFPAGPQDGSHPAARAIAATLAAWPQRQIQVVVPAGNHLQDRCRARIGDDAPGASVFWDIPPEDYSTNEVEVFGPANAPLRLQIAAPGQPLMDVSLPHAQSYRHVLCDGEKVGILMRFSDTGGRSRTRLALWQTAIGQNGVPTPHGRWVLSTDGAAALDLWLFRDDRDPAADRGRPRRPSRFWSAGYQLVDRNGAPPLGDDPGATILRSGTLSVLATSASSAVRASQADERLGSGFPHQAEYSGRPEPGFTKPLAAWLVDDGRVGRGVPVAANGGERRVRMSGSSAAAGLQARALIGIGPPPAS